jgi:hypothetical protein
MEIMLSQLVAVALALEQILPGDIPLILITVEREVPQPWLDLLLQ